MVFFDTSVLIDLFNEKLAGPRRQQIDILMSQVGRTKISIPAPAYIEFLTRADKARAAYQAKIEGSNIFRVEPLSKKASLECAIILDGVFSKKEKSNISRTKIKFDWMIVAIAKAANSTCVYSIDDDIQRACRHAGIRCELVGDIVIPKPGPSTAPLFPDEGVNVPS
jgi:predicted nucleic acid-binding protein